MVYTVEHVLNTQNDLGEGPVWKREEGALYWIDINPGCVHKYIPASATHIQFDLIPPVGCLALRTDGSFIVARERTIEAWSSTTGLGEVMAGFELTDVGQRFNDGAVDPQGRFWVGTIAERNAGFLYRLDSDRSVHRMKTGVGIGNGIGWSPDHRLMYFTDSARSTIFVYDFDPETGAIANERVFDTVTAPGEGVPDGLTVDCEGTIWSARWDGWKIVRYTPSGSIAAEIRLPVQRPTSCAFGGEKLDVLYITSARTELEPAQLQLQPLAGDLFCLQTDTQGCVEPRFIG